MLTAVGSYLQAKHHRGTWLVRIEDLDPPREVKGSASKILRTLEKFGLYWDESICYQSQQQNFYLDALNDLSKKKLLYPCSCSRKLLQLQGVSSGKIGLTYSGNCRNKSLEISNNHAIRLKVDHTDIQFHDQLQGTIQQNLQHDIGDISLKRADGLYTYHLAVVVDDYQQGITEIVRGVDLLRCTPVQNYLQQQLNFSTPHYAHLPIVVNEKNKKLSKKIDAEDIENKSPTELLLLILTLLNQNPPTALVEATKEEILTWAIKHWRLASCTSKTITYASKDKIESS